MVNINKHLLISNIIKEHIFALNGLVKLAKILGDLLLK